MAASYAALCALVALDCHVFLLDSEMEIPRVEAICRDHDLGAVIDPGHENLVLSTENSRPTGDVGRPRAGSRSSLPAARASPSRSLTTGRA